MDQKSMEEKPNFFPDIVKNTLFRNIHMVVIKKHSYGCNSFKIIYEKYFSLGKCSRLKAEQNLL